MVLSLDTWFCDGSYVVNTSGNMITIDNGGVEVFCNGTEILGNTSGKVFTRTNNPADVTIQGCSISNYTRGIYLDNMDNLTIFNNTVENMYSVSGDASGIYVGGNITNSNITNNTVYNISSVAQAFGMLVGQTGNFNENNTVENNKISHLRCLDSGCMLFGLMLLSDAGPYRGDGSIVKNNKIWDFSGTGVANLASGIIVIGELNATVYATNISDITNVDGAAHGITVASRSYFNYSGNRITNVTSGFGTNAINTFYGQNATIENNELWNCTEGINIDNGNNFVVENNNIYNISYGVYVYSSNNSQFIDNAVINSSERGFQFFNSSHNIIRRGNVSFTTDNAITFEDGGINNNISGVYVSNTPSLGIKLSYITESVIFNTTVYNGAAGVWFDHSNDSLIYNNTFHANTYGVGLGPQSENNTFYCQSYAKI